MTDIPGIGVRHHHRDVVRTVEEIRKRLGLALYQVIATGTQALDTSPATTTTVSDANVTTDSRIQWQPEDAGAASIDGLGTYVSSVASGSFVFTHDSSSATRTYRYFVLD